MNSVFKITFIFLCAINSLFAQPTNYKKHTVQKGETLFKIAKKSLSISSSHNFK